MIIDQQLYSFDDVMEIMGVSSEALFSVLASPYVEKVQKGNRIYLTRETVRKLTERGDF